MAHLAILYDPVFLKHDPGEGHVEAPRRLQSIMNYLQKNGFLNKVSVYSPQEATTEQLSLVHTPEYIQSILQLRGVEHYVVDRGDTVVTEQSVDAALRAAGAAVSAVDMIFTQQFDKIFAAVRPPGHHAEADRAMGFCIFNNIALAARYALQKENVQRVLIIDWDVHHGNGTQHIFYEDASVFYLSLHQFPFYPRSGSVEESGTGAGEGFTMNIPLPAGQTDDAYMHHLEQALAEIETRFKPDLVLLSAGFDAHQSDPLGGMRLSADGFYKLTELAARFAQRYANGRVISFLEGGYSYPGLAESVYEHLKCLIKH